ncbi:PP2C family serine/threonine-protein phosphatase [Corallococcus aberystwythensis]|nr:PP2C family serine/threonine-protein phosphatase [Corallococcus aberystwythensis]
MGASVRGPEHRGDGRPNQDAWLSRLARGTALAVVCDGLGSRPHSAAGSRAACHAVADAVRHWANGPVVPPELLLRLIHALWNVRVHHTGRDESATTCLFAVVTKDGRLLLAQLGDGLVMLKTPKGTTTLEPPDERFGTATTGLGVASDVREWRLHLERNFTGAASILLATDGVADDLVLEKRADFLSFLVTQYGPRPATARARAIAKELREWPTPRHRDDKTVAVLWNDTTTEASP